MLRDLADVFAREIAGRRALEWTAGLTRYHREPGMPGHRRALEYIVGAVEGLGLDEVEEREYVYDGRRVYYSTWASVAQWTPRAGILEVVAPEHRVLADFSEIPVVLGIRSAPTPPGGITAELVDVGPGNLPVHYEGKDVRGKIVLSDPNGQLGVMVMDMARLFGAKGVVICNLIDHPPAKTREDRPDHIAHVWTTYWFLGVPHDFDSDIFSFSVSPRQLGYLRMMLARGPVTVRAVVDAEFSGGTVRQISGLIRGSERPDEEVVYLGHVDHPWPGANDNASGCGLNLELAHTLAMLIRKGELPRPRRSIRFLWDVHVTGGVMWAEDHPDWGRRVLAGFAPDSVGIGARDGATPQLIKTSDTRPSYLNDLVVFLGEKLPVSGLRSHQTRLEPGPAVWDFREAPWSGGVDSGPINDRTIGAHAVGIGGYLFDRAYHTDQDTYTRLDVQELERVGWLLSMAGYLVANADEQTSRFLSTIIAAAARRRLARITTDVVLALEDVTSFQGVALGVRQWLDRAVYVARRDIAALHSVTTLGSGDKLTSTLSDYEGEINDAAEAAQASITRWARDHFGWKDRPSPALRDEEAQAASLIPVRRFRGPFNYHDLRRILAAKIGWERTHWLAELQSNLPYPSLSYSGIPAVFLAMDGKTSLLEITRAVMSEYGVSPDPGILLHLAEDLVDADLIDLVEANGNSRALRTTR